MAKLRVLMIGPGEPNALNSGLGVAANNIANSLAKKIELILIQPEDLGQEHSKKDFIRKIKDIDSREFSEMNLMSDLIKINVRSEISPYFYPYIDTTAEQKSTKTKSKNSAVKKELDNFTKNVVRESGKVDFDLVYAHDWTAVPAGLEIKQKTKKPLVVHMHSLDYDRNSKLNHSWVYELEKESFEKADAVISVSDYTSNVIAENYEGIAESKVHTVYNGNEPLSTKKVEKVFHEKLVLFVGRLTGQKGPNIFMEIAEKVLQKHKNTRFVLAGDGHMMPDLVKAAAAKKIGSKFHFTGHINKEQLEELYAMADVYCMPSVSEPFGLTAIEAANAGLPVVLSRQSGAAEVLSGALCSDHWDVDGFVKHILAVFKSDKKRKKMVEDNKKDLKSLTWDSTAAKVLEVFNKVK